MNRKSLQELALIRLREAKILLGAGASDGAYYLAGFAIECALKACVARATERHDFPDKQRAIDSHTHDAAKLISVAGLKAAYVAAMQEDDFARRWKIVLKWSSKTRYGASSIEDAKALIEAIENQKHGVLPWLKKHW